MEEREEDRGGESIEDREAGGNGRGSLTAL